MGMWTHPMKKIYLCLCLDDFGLKCLKKQGTQEFLNHLETTYKDTVDWSGRNLCALKFDWDYNKGHVDRYMRNYVINALNRFQHNNQQCQYFPHAHLPIIYGKAGQRHYTTSPDTSQALTSQDMT